ncbi:MAG: MoxR family ATPase, partial [Verrucomicrobiales bacterium]|nr:MoxR family ATPase [Verrucomicrobiales bacterium]
SIFQTSKMAKELTHTQLLERLRQAGEQGFNVLMEGPAGTGKTSLVQQVSKELGLRLKYYSASTLDPFVDLVGLPTPVTREDGTRALEFHRHEEINEAELVFFDELNRAHTKVLNAVLEMIQFQTINGDPLPKLKAVFAAINPSDGDYQVTDLDPALVDRFHVHLKFGNAPDRSWFVEKYGATGKALCDWWSVDLVPEQSRTISPRKLEHIAMLLGKGFDPADSIPEKNTKLPFHLLKERLHSPHAVLDIKDFVKEPDTFEKLVAQDQEMALRLIQLLPAMKPMQLFEVRMIILALPPELLARVNVDQIFMKRLYDGIGKKLGAAEKKVYRELVEEQLKGS